MKVGRPKISDPMVNLTVRVKEGKKEQVKKLIYMVRDNPEALVCPYCKKIVVLVEVEE